jgi:hypothetical protein
LAGGDLATLLVTSGALTDALLQLLGDALACSGNIGLSFWPPTSA